MCSLLGYTKQAYYKGQRYLEKEAFEEDLIVGLIREKRTIWKGGSGRNLLKCLNPELERHGLRIGRDKFFELLGRNNLLTRHQKRRVSTTDSYHRYHKYPNLVKEMQPQKAGQVWVSDITYVWLSAEERFCYLFLITDLYSRKIIGYAVSASLKAEGALQALRMAVKGMFPSQRAECIHHSDRGVQYCCDDYVALLRQHSIRISMTENSDPLENAVAERVNKTIKEEFTDERELSFTSLAIARRELKKYITFYNDERPHRSIDWLTPSVAHQQQGLLKRHWKSYYRKEDVGGIAEA